MVEDKVGSALTAQDRAVIIGVGEGKDISGVCFQFYTSLSVLSAVLVTNAEIWAKKAPPEVLSRYQA